MLFISLSKKGATKIFGYPLNGRTGELAEVLLLISGLIFDRLILNSRN